MSRMYRAAIAILSFMALAALATSSRADFEAKLLQKFKNNNQASAEKLRNDVTDSLARALSTGQRDPKELLSRLQRDLTRLEDDSYLPKDERASLIRQIKEFLPGLRIEVAKMIPKQEPLPPMTAAVPKEEEKTMAPRDRTRRVGPFAPGFGTANSNAAFQVTPVVSPGRRWIRLGISGGFAGFHSFGLNTTVSVPDGGTTVVGSYSTLSEARSEYGAPILGKVPYLGRLGRNVSFGRQISHTGISVSARIIDLHELEELFLQSGSRP